MSTIRDVAKLANVSVATVSRVLNYSLSVSENTRLVVEQAIAQLAYQPNANAQALAVQKHRYNWRGGNRCDGCLFAILVKAVDKVAEAHQKRFLSVLVIIMQKKSGKQLTPYYVSVVVLLLYILKPYLMTN